MTVKTKGTFCAMGCGMHGLEGDSGDTLLSSLPLLKEGYPIV